MADLLPTRLCQHIDQLLWKAEVDLENVEDMYLRLGAPGKNRGSGRRSFKYACCPARSLHHKKSDVPHWLRSIPDTFGRRWEGISDEENSRVSLAVL